MGELTFQGLLCGLAAMCAADDVRAYEAHAIADAIAAYVGDPSDGDLDDLDAFRAHVARLAPGAVREGAYLVVRNLLAPNGSTRLWWHDTAIAALGLPIALGDEREQEAMILEAVRASDDAAWRALGAAVLVAAVYARRDSFGALLREMPEARSAVLRSQALATLFRQDTAAARAIVRAVFTRGDAGREELFDAEVSCET